MKAFLSVGGVITFVGLFVFALHQKPCSYSDNEKVTAKITGLSSEKTYVIDKHGCKDYLYGLWGDAGDEIIVWCDSGYLRKSRPCNHDHEEKE